MLFKNILYPRRVYLCITIHISYCLLSLQALRAVHGTLIAHCHWMVLLFHAMVTVILLSFEKNNLPFYCYYAYINIYVNLLCKYRSYFPPSPRLACLYDPISDGIFKRLFIKDVHFVKFKVQRLRKTGDLS